MVTIPANQSRRRVDVSLFDIFGPGRPIRRSKPKKPTNAAATSTPATAPPPAPAAAPPGPPPARAPVRSSGRPSGPPQGRPPGPPLGPPPGPVPSALPDPLPGALPGPSPQSPAAPSAAAQASDTKTASGWTAEQDAQLLELKAKNTSWKAINEIIQGKGGVQELKERFKELNKDKNDQGKGGETGGGTDKKNKGQKEQDGKGEGSGEGKVGEAKKEGKADDTKKVGDGKKEKNGKGKGKEKQDEKEEETKDHIVYVDEGDDLTVRELVYMFSLAERYEEEKWIKVASRFFDRTGKRVDPQWIAERFGGGS